MGRSTEYYRTHPEARRKKAKKDKEINKRPEAERKARVDPRYESALEDYREFTKTTNVMRNKLNTMKDIHDDIRQSVSTGRSSIIKEGYNQ